MGELAEEGWQREAFGAFGARTMTTIDDAVPVPETGKPKNPGAKRARKTVKAKDSPAAGLVAALNFAALAQAKEGAAYQTHCRMEHGWLMTFNGVLSMGAPIQEDLTACPRTMALIAALTKCGKTLSIAQLNEATIRITSESFRATIDCLPAEQVAFSYPDSPATAIGDEVKIALEALAWLATDGAQQAFCAGVLFKSQTAVATNRHVMCEYWHGYDIAGQFLVPKSFVAALCKINKKLVKAGWTPGNSLTFWFEDTSYLKTQLFNDKFPEYEQIFERADNVPVTVIPPKFYEGLDAIQSFSKDKYIHFHTNRLCSDSDEEKGACYDLVGLPGGMKFNAEYLQGIKPWFENVRIPTPTMMAFSKGMMRGACMGAVPNE